MNGKYRGVLFTVVSHDANQQIFSLAFGIGDSENDASWIWFFRRLKENFGEIHGHVIISDHHRSINRAVNEVFPNVFHGLCIYHLLNNLKAKFKSKTNKLEEHYYQTMKLYSVEELNVLFYILCSTVPGVKKYLEEVRLDRWMHAHSPSRRYNIMTTNILESMNAVLVKVRELPITTFVNEIRLLCQKCFYECHNKVKDCTTKMSIDMEKNLEKRRDRVQVMDSFCVDMALWTCGCRMFQFDQLPCEHALVIARRTAYEAYDFCSPYYSKEHWFESYKGVVHPLPHITQWSILEHISAFKLNLPDV
ncbi:hypothetical protein UlMin_015862 [Ulmus minor]